MTRLIVARSWRQKWARRRRVMMQLMTGRMQVSMSWLNRLSTMKML